MGYFLFTGATGLLGEYLLRDLLDAEVPLAVLARPAGTLTARQRVDDILTRWEKQTGYALPRPVVFEGDLSEPGLGLPDAEINWIRAHCKSVLHNAASLRFSGKHRKREPWKSNLGGTRNLLQLCEMTGIRRFHHVSTAYVCGKRDGVVREDELDVGQENGNDYETSKKESEKLIREASFLTHRTVYRPSIIAGDSDNGYTSTFHGFYFPLKIGWAMAGVAPSPEVVSIRELLTSMGLSGTEQKNFVPVDWVSSVLTHILTHSNLHDQTYHLTSDSPVSLNDMSELFLQIVRDHWDQRPQPSDSMSSWDLDFLMSQFRMQMTAYRTYWRHDPQFDATNTRNAAPHLPCPDINQEMMTRWSQFAIRQDFARPLRPEPPEFNCAEHLEQRFENPDSTNVTCGLQVNGPGGGQWTLFCRDNRIQGLRQGLPDNQPPMLYLNSNTFRRLTDSSLTPACALAAGYVFADRNCKRPLELLSQVIAPLERSSAVDASL